MPAGSESEQDIILFDPYLFATRPRSLYLDKMSLEILEDVTITGPGYYKLSIDADFQSRVLYVGEEAEVNIWRLLSPKSLASTLPVKIISMAAVS